MNFYWPYLLPRGRDGLGGGGRGKGRGEGMGRIKHGSYVLSCMIENSEQQVFPLFIQSDSYALKTYNIKVRQDNSL